MADLPILFSAPMVQAILDGRKTQTRRIVMGAKEIAEGPWLRIRQQDHLGWRAGLAEINVWRDLKVRFAVDDRLWVRETHCLGSYKLPFAKRRHASGQSPVVYSTERASHKQYEHFKWRPSIHMPRWMSRLTLTLTDVRVQRLQEISEEDADAEGIVRIGRSLTRDGRMDGYGVAGTAPDDASTTRANAFWKLWDKINGRGSWDDNPWVVALTFTVEKRNIDA